MENCRVCTDRSIPLRSVAGHYSVLRDGGEAATALDCFEQLAPLLPGAHGVIYDTALRGVHHQHP
jgi:hypothetical protein